MTESDSEECIIQKIINNDDKYFHQNENIKDTLSTKKIVNPEDKISTKRMTKYEFVRLIGTRVQQLTKDAKPMIKNTQGLSHHEIAELEIKHNVIPIKIKRHLPNGNYEIWKVSELDKNHLFL